MAASACSLAFVGEHLQLIKKSSFKLTEKNLAYLRYSVVFTDVSDIGQGRQIWEGGGRATTVIVGWFAGRTCQNNIKCYT
jgi:hypothetical protein